MCKIRRGAWPPTATSLFPASPAFPSGSGASFRAPAASRSLSFRSRSSPWSSSSPPASTSPRTAAPRPSASSRLEQTAERVERIRAEQRPRFERGTPAGRDVAARASLVASLPIAIQADARERVAAGALDGPIRSVECEPYPRSVDGRGAHLDPSQPTGRYSCLAVTRGVQATERNEAASIGHPYRVLVQFDTGRYAFCKVSGRPGEGSLERDIAVTVPEACGGR